MDRTDWLWILVIAVLASWVGCPGSAARMAAKAEVLALVKQECLK